MIRYVTSLVMFFFCLQIVNAQLDSLSSVTTGTVLVKATRIPIPLLREPFSLSKYQKSPLQDTRQQLSFQEYLSHISGVFSMNANNYAQDLRIAIRGFGSRAAFGIRGIKIIVDGIPETTPDGQGQIDNLNLGVIESIEVLKGPASALYGNASGGVISIFSQEKIKENFIEAGLTLGSFQMQQYQLKGGLALDQTRMIFQGTHTRSDGYRRQSGFENTNLNFRLFHDFSKKSKLNLQVNYTNSPIGDDPGGLTIEEVMTDRRQARSRNVDFKTGEAIDQFKGGARYQFKINDQQNIELYSFYSQRNFEGRLPFRFGGWINLKRNYWGQGGHYKYRKFTQKYTNTFQVGYEWASQNDARERFENNEGLKGDITINQIEGFNNFGVYLLDHFEFKDWLVTGGLRYDWNELKVDDRRLVNGDQSAKRILNAFNSNLGLTYRPFIFTSLYANYRSSFETPSLSELSANPTGEAGFNTGLKSQQADNFDLGIKGFVSGQVNFDLALFYIKTKNDLVPFELEVFPDRNFFRNAGSTNRKGIECSIDYKINQPFAVKASYTFSQFKYEEYELPDGDFSGKFLPGIPEHYASLILQYQNERGINFRLQHRFIGQLYANDSNETSVSSYHLTDLSLGYRWKRKTQVWTPFFGINNLFNAEFMDNVRINVSGNRYYESGPSLNIYGGIRYHWSDQKKNKSLH